MRAARSGFVLLFLAVGCTKFVPSVPVIELVSIPAGSFVMGSLQGEKGRLDDEAVCTVTLARPFLLGKMEVTQGQWRKVMGTEPWKWQAFVQAGNDYAVTCVSWNDATAFCDKLTDLESKTGKLKAGEAYRLPTEAEWEYACRAGTTTAFSFGEDESKLSDFAWFDGNTKMNDTLTRSAEKCPTPGACMTCTETRGNGAQIGTVRSCRVAPIRLAPEKARTAWFAAVIGGIPLPTADRRPVSFLFRLPAIST